MAFLGAADICVLLTLLYGIADGMICYKTAVDYYSYDYGSTVYRAEIEYCSNGYTCCSWTEGCCSDYYQNYSTKEDKTTLSFGKSLGLLFAVLFAIGICFTCCFLRSRSLRRQPETDTPVAFSSQQNGTRIVRTQYPVLTLEFVQTGSTADRQSRRNGSIHSRSSRSTDNENYNGSDVDRQSITSQDMTQINAPPPYVPSAPPPSYDEIMSNQYPQYTSDREIHRHTASDETFDDDG